MASKMEKSLQTIIDTFHENSVQLGHPDTLNKQEFKNLVKKNLPNFLKKEKKNDATITDIMEDLDSNGDGQLSFNEFIMLLAKLTVATHEKMHACTPRAGPDHRHGPGLGEGRGRGQCH